MSEKFPFSSTDRAIKPSKIVPLKTEILNKYFSGSHS